MWLAEVSHKTHTPRALSSLYTGSAGGGDKENLMRGEDFCPISKQAQSSKSRPRHTYLAHVSSYTCVSTQKVHFLPCNKYCNKRCVRI